MCQNPVPLIVPSAKLCPFRQLRRSFYNSMKASRDEEVQRRGTIIVCWGTGDAKGTISENQDLNAKLPKLNDACPLRVSVIHMCITDETWKDRVALMRASMAKTLKVRTRVHFGRSCR